MPNSISDNLQRLQTARSDIAEAITAKGGIVGANDGFEEFVSDIGSIPSGSSGIETGTISYTTSGSATFESYGSDYVYKSGNILSSYFYIRAQSSGYTISANTVIATISGITIPEFTTTTQDRNMFLHYYISGYGEQWQKQNDVLVYDFDTSSNIITLKFNTSWGNSNSKTSLLQIFGNIQFN